MRRFENGPPLLNLRIYDHIGQRVYSCPCHNDVEVPGAAWHSISLAAAPAVRLCSECRSPWIGKNKFIRGVEAHGWGKTNGQVTNFGGTCKSKELPLV